MTTIVAEKYIRWGLLGTASIARRQAIPAIKSSSSGVLHAVGSRDIARAKSFADEFGIPKAFGSYEEVLDLDTVDAVYIPLPNDLHLPWIKKAIDKGKHVLCEKPIGLNAAEVREAMEYARKKNNGVQVMEGISTYFHPIHQRAAQLIADGAIGRPVFLRFSLGWSFRDKPDDYRWKKSHGGGSLLDLGCYPISTARTLIGQEPERVVARASLSSSAPDRWIGSSSPPKGAVEDEEAVDTNVAIMLSFPRSVAMIDIGIATAARNFYEVIGTDGKLTAYEPFGNRVDSRRLALYDHTGALQNEEHFSANQIELQFEAMTEALLAGDPLPISLKESFTNARIIDACFSSAEAGGETVDIDIDQG